MRKIFGPGLALLIILLAHVCVSAHEYWIEPLDFTPVLHEQTQAHLKVGSDFKGQSLSFIPLFTKGYEISDQSGTRELEGAAGDRPALTYIPQTPGLNIITYQSTKNLVTFSEWETFASYLDKQGMGDIIARHQARGLPQTGFSESYSRYAKSLISVGGDVSGADLATGMHIELVALKNPYALAPGDELAVQLLFEGQPLSNNQVSVFVQGQEFQDQELEIMRLRTNNNGEVRFQLIPDAIYMLNAIKIIEVEERSKEVWESFWASLTFQVSQ